MESHGRSGGRTSPPLASSTSITTGDGSSEYFTDADGATTTGSRTPTGRQSMDLSYLRPGYTPGADTDTESQLYQDARSFADVSTTSLALPQVSTTNVSRVPGTPMGSRTHQTGGYLTAPGRHQSALETAATPDQHFTTSEGIVMTLKPTDSIATSDKPTQSGGEDASQEIHKQLPHENDSQARHPILEQEPNADASKGGLAGIDAATIAAHEKDPEATADAVSAATKADVAVESAQQLNKEAGSSAPFTNIPKTDGTLPSPDKQATDPLAEEDRPIVPAVDAVHSQDGTNHHASVEKSLLGVGAASTAATAAAHSGDSRPESTAVDMNGQGRSKSSPSSSSDGAMNEKGEHEKKGLFGGGKRSKDKDGKKKKKGKGSKEKENPEDSPDLAHFTPEQRRIILAQTEMGNGNKTATYLDIFKFSTKFEIFLDIIGLFAAILSGIVQPAMTLIFGNLTTAFTEFGTRLATGQDTSAARDQLFNEVNKDALILLGIGIGMFVTTYIYMATWIWTGETTTRRIREGYLRAILRQNVGFFDSIGAGEVTTRITSDVHLIQEGISEKVPITFQFVSQFFAGFVVAFARNWRMTIVLSSIVPAIAGAGGVMATWQAKYRTKMLSFVAEGGSLAEETISSVRTTHAFGTQKKLVALYDVSNNKAFAYGRKTAVLSGAGLSVFFFIIYAAYALAFWWGATLLIRGQATSGEIITCFFAVLIGAFSLSQVAPNLQAVGYAVGAANKLLFTIWRVPPIDSASTEGQKLAKVQGTLTLENVDFYYPSRPSVKILDNISATFPENKITALVGASGSGKSSIIGLFERFYDVVGGTVRLDGHDISQMNVGWLRSQIGLVSQEPTLFASKIWENVAYGLINTPYEHESEEVRRKMVQGACELANAHDFIANLPDGYDTHIGERGMLLSGGQKQRIAIARAVVSNPRILLLDEATSALDTQSEKLVQKALDQAATGRTTITIAHRLSTIKDADQIIVMSKGVILEQGTHNELLMNENGAYAALVRAQALKEEQTGEQNAEVKDEQEEADLLQQEAEEARAMGIKRTGTGRSEVSDILDRKREEAESHKPKEHGVIYLLIRLIKEIKDAKWYYFIGTVFSIVLGMIYPVFAIVFGHILGVFSSTDDSYVRSRGDYYAGLLFAIACVSSLSIAIQAYVFGYTSEYLSRVLRSRIFGTILRQDVSFFDEDRNSTGALTSSISEQPQKVNAALGITLGVILQNIITLVGGIAVGLAYAWKLSLVGLACIPLTLSAGIVRLRVVNLKDEKTRRSHEDAAQTACEAAGAIRTVASLTRESDAVRQYSKALDEPMRVSNRIALVSNVFFSVTQALSFPVIALIFWYGAHQIVDHGLSTQAFFTSLTAVIFGSIQAGNVFTFVPDVSSAKGAAAKIVRLFDGEVEIDAQNPEGKALQNTQGHVVFKNVHFRYPTRPGVRVLRGLNLNIKPGEFVALVGPSGCGKSTIIQLIERFYDPILGSIEIDGQNISEANVKSLRESISLVSQEPTLYDGSVRFNITLGATDEPSQAEVEEACKAANIYDFIQSLPDGFDTMVGGKGSQLSGGQKQRIAIARALIRNPKILLLDEATSALDSQSEKVVQAALDAAAKNRTTIAVAHRLSTIQNADHIFVLREGRIAERGTHSELIHLGGIYAELVQQQALEKRA